MNKKIRFSITTADYVEIVDKCKECDPEDIYSLDEITIYLHTHGKRYPLCTDFLFPIVRDFEGVLQFALENKLQFNDPEQKDIGFLWSEHLNQLDKAVHHSEKNFEWNYNNLLVWEYVKTKATTWMYNKNNSIVLEVTPGYPWHFLPKKGKNYITYKTFIKNYAPITRIEFSHTIAAQWLAQAQELIQIMEKTYEKYASRKESQKNT